VAGFFKFKSRFAEFCCKVGHNHIFRNLTETPGKFADPLAGCLYLR
jgi:hypothetical protein